MRKIVNLTPIFGITAAIALAGSSVAVAAPASAVQQGTPASSHQQGNSDKTVMHSGGLTVEKLNASQVKISSSKYQFVMKDGRLGATDRSGKEYRLPSYGQDANGNRVKYVYNLEKGDVILSAVLDNSSDEVVSARGFGDDLGCWSGVVASGVLGGLTGLAAGPAGAVAGAIAGNTIGTLSFC